MTEKRMVKLPDAVADELGLERGVLHEATVEAVSATVEEAELSVEIDWED